jgi:hypothetical protein
MSGAALTIIREDPEQARRPVSHRFPLPHVGEAFRTANDNSTASLKVQVQL